MRRRSKEIPNANADTLVGSDQLYYRGVPFWDPSLSLYNHYLYRGAYRQQDVCLDETHPGPPFHTGGPLTVFHWRDGGTDIKGWGRYTAPITPEMYRVYTGGFLPTAKWQDVGLGYSVANFSSEFLNPGSMFPSSVNAGAYGATGWNRFRPGNPTADLGVFIGEIGDVPKTLKGTAKFFRDLWKSQGGSLTRKPGKALSDQWLSTQFGWLPFINDLRKFYRTYRNLDRQIAHIRRNNGRWCKRGGSIVDVTDAVEVGSNPTVSGHWPALQIFFYANWSSSGNQSMVVRRTTKVWFEGAFRYWIPSIDTPLWEARAVAELFGSFPNPALIWELTPFSWLVDWVSNVGDVVSNMDTGWADNLAAKYAYVMKSDEVTGEFSSTLDLLSGHLRHTWDFPVSWKSRVGASRFGFGLTELDFTARQWSILGALGLQRRRKF